MQNRSNDDGQPSPVARRRRVNQLQRAVAAVQLAVDGLAESDQLIVLHVVLSDTLRVARETERRVSRASAV
jgi:hypothetical protein